MFSLKRLLGVLHADKKKNTSCKTVLPCYFIYLFNYETSCVLLDWCGRRNDFLLRSLQMTVSHKKINKSLYSYNEK